MLSSSKVRETESVSTIVILLAIGDAAGALGVPVFLNFNDELVEENPGIVEHGHQVMVDVLEVSRMADSGNLIAGCCQFGEVGESRHLGNGLQDGQ
jgi:hypothetical protein